MRSNYKDSQFQIMGGAVPVRQLFDFEVEQLNVPLTQLATESAATPQGMTDTGDAGQADLQGQYDNLSFNTQAVALAAFVWVQIAPANPTRRYLLIQNQSATDIAQVYFGAQPGAVFGGAGGSFGTEIGPGQSYEMFFRVPKNQVWANLAPSAAAAIPLSVVQG